MVVGGEGLVGVKSVSLFVCVCVCVRFHSRVSVNEQCVSLRSRVSKSV